MATVPVPARTTSALTVPAGTSSVASFGLVSPGATTWPPARTSTAGAAAVCRTVTRDWPAGTGEVSLTNGVRAGAPLPSGWATTVAFGPAGDAAPLPPRHGVARPPGAAAGQGARGWAAGEGRGCVTDRCQTRTAAPVEVGDHGGVRTGGDGDAVRRQQRGARAVGGVGREERQVVAAGGQLQRVGERAGLEVV